MKIRNLEEYCLAYRQSVENPESFWEHIASSFSWHQKWSKVLDWSFDDFYVKWFLDAKLNITENCIDRHLPHKAHQTAIIWEGNSPDEPHQYISYQELYHRVCRFANVLRSLGVEKGDRVCLYMPMVPELAIAALACARIGAIHSVVFGGFSTQALADRIHDAQAKVVVTANEAYRGNKTISLKSIVDEAVAQCDCIKNVVVFRRTDAPTLMQGGRDSWWHEAEKGVSEECPPTYVDSEDPLFILYTSGSTGKPKGVLHTTAGYMIHAQYSFENVFQYKEGEIYWCTADIGWITGHTYVVYAPLLAGGTSLMFEGIPTYPDAGRFWQVIEKHNVNIFYTAPTAIRSLQAFGTEEIEKYDLSSLRLLGSVGEPINEEAWKWYHHHIGKDKCPIVDTWWQTETGGIMISPLAGITPTKPSFATLPLPGIQVALVDSQGKEIEGNSVEGNLVIKFPFPSMLRTTFGDHERCKKTYFSDYKGYYATGDGCRRDEEGYYRIIGRTDDVIKVSGHRLGTAEIEDAINTHPAAIESAVVGFPHAIKGEAIYAYIICDESHLHTDENALRKEIIDTVSKTMGAIAKPDKIQFVKGLPKTRSGKIMRRILRKIASGDASSLGDTSTLLDPTIVESIKEGAL